MLYIFIYFGKIGILGGSFLNGFGCFLNLRYYKIWMLGKKLKVIEIKVVSVYLKRYK